MIRRNEVAGRLKLNAELACAALAHFLRDGIESAGAAGLVATNPPYGQRLGSETELRPLYETIGSVLRERFAGWKAGCPVCQRRNA